MDTRSFPAWHCVTINEAMEKLEAKADGLSDAEVEKRLKQFGPNELTATARISPFALFLNQFKNTLIIILLVAAVLSGFMGHAVEAIAIGVITIFAVTLGFIQEFRAEKALEALQKMAAPLALVLRSGTEREIPVRELVPGDIIILGVGDRVPADARLIWTANLKAEEAALTGESVSVEKNCEKSYPQKAVVGDRRNMVFSGTNITYGRGKAVVAATGMQTEFGRIADMLQGMKREETPLQKNLDKVGKMLTKTAFVVVIGVILLGLFRGQPFIEMIVFGIALAVAVVPEALPAVVTISLAIGVQRMSKRHALVRHLPAVETLGCTSIICSDKTGTLTKDEMTVRKIFLPTGMTVEVTGIGYEPKGDFLLQGRPFQLTDGARLLLIAATLASDARLVKMGGTWDLNGDSTEGALVVAAEKAGFNKELLEEESPRTAEIPFTSESKRMTTLHRTSHGTVAYGKGAAEIILSSSSYYYSESGILPLTDEIRSKVLNAVQVFATDALRVIGVAYKKEADIKDAERDMTFLGFFGMIDPPRPEAKQAILRCRQAGIDLMMITGDHPKTAEAVARELNLLSEGEKVVTGEELSAMSDDDLERSISDIAVCARVSPEHKLRLVEMLQRRGHIVAMTGDGINDAPALKKADVGIAMGITGTDVTKEASEITLTDDNFTSIVAAIEEGRIIFGNIKKYLMYLLSSNIGEIGLMAVASLLGLPIPLTAVQILYVNLATDGLPALALAVDPPDSGVMLSSPRKQAEGIFTRSVVALLFVGGIWTAAVNLGLFIWARETGRSITESMTMVFMSIVLIQFFNAYNFRSDHRSAFYKPFANKWLNRAVLWEFSLLLLVVHLSFLQKPFSTMALPLIDWLLVTGVAFSIIPVVELAKLFFKR